MATVGVGDSHTSVKAELLRAHGCPIPILADKNPIKNIAHQLVMLSPAWCSRCSIPGEPSVAFLGPEVGFQGAEMAREPVRVVR
jgi:hypothetical protein